MPRTAVGAGALAQDDRAQQRRRDRLGERERGDLVGGEVPQAGGEQDVGEAVGTAPSQSAMAAPPGWRASARRRGGGRAEQDRAGAEEARHHRLDLMALVEQPLGRRA